MSIPSDPIRLREIALGFAVGVLCAFVTTPTTTTAAEPGHHEDHDKKHGHDDHDEQRGHDDHPGHDDHEAKRGHDDHPGHDDHDEQRGHDDHPGHDDHEAKHGNDDHAGHDDHEEVSFSVADFEEHGVGLDTAGSGVVDVGIELPAEVRPDADRLAHLAPRFPGIVREVRKHVGDSVRAGDVLALIESENLATYRLTAAFDGTVIDKHITPGEAVSRQQPAYIIADLSTVWVNISVYQKALPQIRTGQSVLISTTDDVQQTEGTISYIAPVVNQATRTATARVVLPNPDGVWRPGLFVVATVVLPIEASVVVPRRALHTHEGQTVLFVVEGDSFVVRPVSVGRVGRTRAEIVSGLISGERFADQGSFLVKADLGKGSAEHSH